MIGIRRMRRTNLPTRPCRKTYGRHKDSKRTRLIHRPCGDIAPPVGGIHVSPAPSPGGTTSECSRETMIRGLHCSLFAMLSVIAVIHADRRRSCLRAVVPVLHCLNISWMEGCLAAPAASWSELSHERFGRAASLGTFRVAARVRRYGGCWVTPSKQSRSKTHLD
jgi:hypothetical protein